MGILITKLFCSSSLPDYSHFSITIFTIKVLLNSPPMWLVGCMLGAGCWWCINCAPCRPEEQIIDAGHTELTINMLWSLYIHIRNYSSITVDLDTQQILACEMSCAHSCASRHTMIYHLVNINVEYIHHKRSTITCGHHVLKEIYTVKRNVSLPSRKVVLCKGN